MRPHGPLVSDRTGPARRACRRARLWCSAPWWLLSRSA